SLICRKINGSNYFYNQITTPNSEKKKVSIYLGTESDEEVQLFKRNRINQERLKILDANRELLEGAKSKYRSTLPSDIMSRLPKTYYDISNEYFYDSRPNDIFDWARQDYSTNSHPFDERATIACDGRMVRSKSECIWYENLLHRDIPFRYEDRLELFDENGNIAVRYPDFTIKCYSGRPLYIEQVGMILNEDYANAFMRKIQLYELNDIVLGDNLIVFADNQYSAINSLMVNMTIDNIIVPLVRGR
ncbi:MAG TPA: hypothetical protein VJY37_03805, partial [Anaerovoracaceae bacterium]|nr:hypothetical protein [Anaerovoracaceae bacterium]